MEINNKRIILVENLKIKKRYIFLYYYLLFSLLNTNRLIYFLLK